MRRLMLLVVLTVALVFSPQKTNAADVFIGNEDAYECYIVEETIDEKPDTILASVKYVRDGEVAEVVDWWFRYSGDIWYYKTSQMTERPVQVRRGTIADKILWYCFDNHSRKE